jgi:phage gp36-like protein
MRFEMGQYISLDDVRERIGSARLNGLCGQASQEELLPEAVARAEALVDSYAAARYALPLQSSPLLSEWALRVVEYELYKRTPGDAVPQKIKDSYEDVLKQLAALSSGALKIVSPLSRSSAFSVAAPGGPSFFDNFSMGGF